MKRFLFFSILLFPLIFCSQNEFKKWYFGYNTGLDFMTSPPTVITHTTLQIFEGSASIADAAGNLLFYTDGTQVWNKQHQIMVNGTGLLGCHSTVQSSIIIQKPGSSCLYYIFTLDCQGWTDGLMYSVVDICANSGLGAVITKNVPLHTPCTEHLGAVRHCNGTDVWVVSHDFNSNTFLSYLLSSAGVNTTAVSSVVGPTVSGLGQGTLKFSPSGKKMGFTGFNWIPKIVTLFDFDVATGMVNNPMTVLSTTNLTCYGCEFSPDNSRFYTKGDTSIFQWDLCAGSNSAIAASKVTVGTAPGIWGQLQLAPNGQIYIVRTGTQILDGILNPNGLGVACNFSTQVLSVAPGKNGSGFPNFIAGVYTNISSLSFTSTPAKNCGTSTFAAPALSFTSTFCSSTTYPVNSLSWDFGHPQSGVANTSTLSNPVHYYGTPGIYYPKMIIHYACGTDTIRDTIIVLSNPEPAAENATICLENSYTLSASGSQTYVWMPGNVASQTVVINPISNSNYTVTGTQSNGCVNSKTVSVFVAPCIGIDELTTSQEILIFPNPALNQLTLFIVEETRVNIHSSIGATVYSEKLQPGHYQVPVGDWSKGVYLVEAKTARGKKQQRLIIGE